MFLQRRCDSQLVTSCRRRKEIPLHPIALSTLNFAADVLIGQLVDDDVKLFTVSGIAQQPSFDPLFVRFVELPEQILL